MTAAAPRVWILWHRRRGDLDQMQALAEALGWPTTVKRLTFRQLELPIIARYLFRPRHSDPLDPPWPALVLCSEALTSVIARRLGKMAGGAAKIVCLGRPLGDPANFDLVLTTAQYRLPKAPNIVELSLPLVPETEWTAENTAPGAPCLLALVGGPSPPDELDAAAAGQLVRNLCRRAEATGSTLSILTSPRTPAAIAALIRAALPPPHALVEFDAAAPNPYQRLLAEAEEIIVTSDSVSMVADALAAGKPVSVYALPHRRTAAQKFVEWLWRRPAARWVFDTGLIEAGADRRRLFDKLAAEGRLSWFGTEPPPPQASPLQRDLELAVEQIRALCSSDGRPIKP